jgi:uncharacterized metal-binding protein
MNFEPFRLSGCLVSLVALGILSVVTGAIDTVVVHLHFITKPRRKTEIKFKPVALINANLSA